MKKENNSEGSRPVQKEHKASEQEASKQDEPENHKLVHDRHKHGHAKTDPEFEKLKTEYDSLKNLLQRLQADHENYRKRVEQNKEEIRKSSNRELILELIPVLDHFERALTKADDNDPFVQGIRLIHTQILQVLEKYGVSLIDAHDCKFNPHLHEAICMEEADCEENRVICEMQKGYKLHDSILRHAKVKISKKTSKEGQEKDGEKTE